MGKQLPAPNEHIDYEMVKMEVNLDDMPGELLGYVMELLFEHGANDVYYTPIFMKKNRPGTLLQLLCSEGKLEEMKSILFRETTTLGIRYYPLSVHRLKRVFVTVQTEWGPITVKKGLYGEDVVQWAPEYEDCKQVAQTHGIPLKNVFDAVRMAELNKQDMSN